jgi:hypothetical protein
MRLRFFACCGNHDTEHCPRKDEIHNALRDLKASGGIAHSRNFPLIAVERMYVETRTYCGDCRKFKPLTD